jgi:hypothetical protein
LAIDGTFEGGSLKNVTASLPEPMRARLVVRKVGAQAAG